MNAITQCINSSVGENITKCPRPLDDQDQDMFLVRMWMVIWGYVLPVICSMGVAGNLLTLLVLTLDRTKRTTVMLKYLLHMSLCDLLLLVVHFPAIVQYGWLAEPIHSHITASYFYHVHKVLVSSIQVSGSILVVMVTVERFGAVCFPLHARNWITHRHSRLLLAVAYLSPLLTNLPRSFGVRVVAQQAANSSLAAAENNKRASYIYEELDWFPNYDNTSRTVLNAYIIASVVTVWLLSVLIIVSYRRNERMRRRMTLQCDGKEKEEEKKGLHAAVTSSCKGKGEAGEMHEMSERTRGRGEGTGNVEETSTSGTSKPLLSSKNNNCQKSEKLKQKKCESHYLTVMLACAASVYVVCWLPYTTIQVRAVVLTALNGGVQYTPRSRVEIAADAVAYVLEVLNCSLNFYIYCWWSKRFRDQIKGILVSCYSCRGLSYYNNKMEETTKATSV